MINNISYKLNSEDVILAIQSNERLSNQNFKDTYFIFKLCANIIGSSVDSSYKYSLLPLTNETIKLLSEMDLMEKKIFSKVEDIKNIINTNSETASYNLHNMFHEYEYLSNTRENKLKEIQKINNEIRKLSLKVLSDNLSKNSTKK